MFSAIEGVWLLNGDNNVFTQISLIVLVGMACKNAILLVEFAREKQLQERMNRVTASLGACRLRLRPILMTSLAFTPFHAAVASKNAGVFQCESLLWKWTHHAGKRGLLLVL